MIKSVMILHIVILLIVLSLIVKNIISGSGIIGNSESDATFHITEHCNFNCMEIYPINKRAEKIVMVFMGLGTTQEVVKYYCSLYVKKNMNIRFVFIWFHQFFSYKLVMKMFFNNQSIEFKTDEIKNVIYDLKSNYTDTNVLLIGLSFGGFILSKFTETCDNSLSIKIRTFGSIYFNREIKKFIKHYVIGNDIANILNEVNSSILKRSDIILLGTDTSKIKINEGRYYHILIPRYWKNHLDVMKKSIETIEEFQYN